MLKPLTKPQLQKAADAVEWMIQGNTYQTDDAEEVLNLIQYLSDTAIQYEMTYDGDGLYEFKLV